MGSAATPNPVPLWIDNEEIFTRIKFPVINSDSGKLVHEAYGATPQDAIRAVESAERAFLSWRDRSPWERRNLLRAAATYLNEKRSEVAALIELETPAPSHMIEAVNIDNSIALLEELASAVPLLLNGVVAPSRSPLVTAMIVKEPNGVQLGIAPWNASLLLAIRAVMTPIACGNTAVLKASELCPAIHHFIGRMLADVGFPPGVLNIVQHSRVDAPAVVEAMVAHPAVRKVNFTGSTSVGKVLASLAGRYCKPTLMELGGKAPQIVFADADLDKAASTAVTGAFIHHGQICMATDKVIVHETVFEDLCAKLAAMASVWQMTAAVTDTGASKTESLVRDALEQGATEVVIPSSTINGTQAKTGSSLFTSPVKLRPTILKGVTPSMRLYSEESFGPTMTVHTFSTDEEAIAMANDSPYGLSAGLFTADISKGIRVARKIMSGAVHINGNTIHDEPQLPHGGMKASGWGRFGVPWGFDEFLQLKTITITSEPPSS